MIMEKRVRELGEIAVMAGYVMSLAGDYEEDSSRVFTCKTCHRGFSSFQALGGHRASHKKPRIVAPPPSPPKPKTHECSICGVEFSLGQALGGHMRRHRESGDRKLPVLGLSLATPSVAQVKKGNGRRVLWLDLNLTPSENLFVNLRKDESILD